MVLKGRQAWLQDFPSCSCSVSLIKLACDRIDTPEELEIRFLVFQIELNVRCGRLHAMWAQKHRQSARSMRNDLNDQTLAGEKGRSTRKVNGWHGDTDR
jgi:hypothetical protein